MNIDMKKTLISLLLILGGVTLTAQEWKPADPEATPEAVELFSRLKKIQEKGTM